MILPGEVGVWTSQCCEVALDHSRKAFLLQGDQKHTLSHSLQLIALRRVQVIRAETKQPFPQRCLLWLCCPGGSGMSKDVYNLLQ